MMTCRIDRLALLCFLAFGSPAFAGHAGDMDSPGLLPHELLALLLGLAGIVFVMILILAWVIWRLRAVEQRLREEERKGRRVC